MLRLVKYLKPFTLSILIAIALLFVQANTDLALPDYMSRIVNIGIQQGGVENAVPEVLRLSTLDKLTIFLSAEEQAQVLGAYTLAEPNSPDFPTDITLVDEPVLMLNELTPEQVSALNPVLAKPLLAVAGIEQMLADPAQAAELAPGPGFDLSKLPPGTDVFALLRGLPAAQLEPVMAALNTRFAGMSPEMLVQAAAAPVRAEYDALGMDTGAIQSTYILRVGGQMLLLTLASVAAAIVIGLLASRTAAGVARNLRRDVFRKVEGFSSSEFERFSTASLITRTTNDITQVQMVTFMIIRIVFFAPIMGVGGIIRAMNKDVSMWWTIALGVVILLGLILTVFSIALPKFKAIQKLIDRLNLVTRENLSGMMVIRAFNMQKFEEERFDRANRDLTDTSLFIGRVMATMFPVMMLIMNGLSILIIWVGAHQVAQSSMQVGDMMAFLQYAMQIVFSFLMLSFMFIMLPRASVSGDRIADVLAVQQEIRDPAQPRQFAPDFSGRVEFRNVSFRYPGAEEDVLQKISFTAQPGQTTAIIGSTGSGKSTVVNLIPRFYDVTGGAILLDGVDIRAVSQHDLREKIGYVPQKGTLFSGTIETNLRYADEKATADDLRDSIVIAQAAEFVEDRPEGMAAEISQGGANVSGGQKQRLSIARALVKKAPIYIFDDSFSALDFKTDAALRRALKDKLAGSTILIVTQRISTIKNAEQIVVLDEGRVVGVGTHKELMQSCEPYREIALSQLSMEELA